MICLFERTVISSIPFFIFGRQRLPYCRMPSINSGRSARNGRCRGNWALNRPSEEKWMRGRRIAVNVLHIVRIADTIPDTIPDATGGHFAEVALCAAASVTSRVSYLYTGSEISCESKKVGSSYC